MCAVTCQAQVSLHNGDLGVCRTHEGGSGINMYVQEFDPEGYKNCPSPCPARRSNPGSLDLNSEALTIELRPRSAHRTADTFCTCGVFVGFFLHSSIGGVVYVTVF